MVKQGFMKTMEILMVIVMTTIFVLTVIPRSNETYREKQKFYLNSLEDDLTFREFVNSNTNCFNSTEDISAINLLRSYVPSEYDFRLCVDSIPNNLPAKSVVVDTMFFAGNYTDIDTKIIRLYYWVS